MTILAISAPTAFLGGITAAAGTFAATTDGSHALGTDTGFTIAGNNGLLLLHIYIAVTGGTLQFVCANTANNPAAITLPSSAAHYFFGPFDPAIYNNAATGLMNATLAGTATNYFGVWYMSASAPIVGYREFHNPFQATLGAIDY